MSVKAKTILFCFIIGLVGYTLGLSSLELIGQNCRYALYVHEMKESGLTPFPMLLGQNYLYYPSFHPLLMLISSLVFRGIDLFSLAFPSALAGAIVLVLTYLIGEKHSHRFGLIAAALLGCTYQFIVIARSPSPDMLITLLTVLSFYLSFSADFEKKPLRLGAVPFLCLIGFVIRGPVGTIIPVAAVAGYYLAAKKPNLLFGMVITSILMMLIACGWLGVWAFGLNPDKWLPGLNQLFLVKYYGDAPFWYYFVNGMVVYAITLPLAFFVMGTYLLRKGIKYFAWESVYTPALLRQALTFWILIIMVGLTFPGTKHFHYLVVVIPAAALMGAFVFENFDKIPLFNQVSRWLIRVLRYLPLALVMIMLVGSIVLKMLGIEVDYPLLMPAICLMIVGAMIFIIPKQKKIKDDTVLVLSMTFVGMVLLQITFFEPVKQRLETSTAFVQKVEKIRPEGVAVCFYGINREKEMLNYMVNVSRNRDLHPKYIEPSKDPEGQKVLLTLPKFMPIIVRAEDFDTLYPDIRKNLKVVAEGKLGRTKCKAVLPVEDKK